ncbi:MAG: type II toxin-antitoxin system Phd/YefM family antitoxin [Candidatus Sumerlaeaceae bacterium]
MHLNDDIRTSSYLKLKTSELLNQVSKTRRPVVITENGKPKAVIQDAETYEQMNTAVALLKLIAHSEAQIAQGKVLSQDQVFKRLRKKLRS